MSNLTPKEILLKTQIFSEKLIIFAQFELQFLYVS